MLVSRQICPKVLYRALDHFTAGAGNRWVQSASCVEGRGTRALDRPGDREDWAGDEVCANPTVLLEVETLVESPTFR